MSAEKKVVRLDEWLEGRDGGGGSGGEPPAGGPPDDASEPMWASDDFLAVKLVDRLVPDWVFVASWNHWLNWQGSHWEQERTLAVFCHTREICRAIRRATEATPATLRGIESAKTVAAAVSLARNDRRIAKRDDIWDRELHLLNTPGGVVDLRTGTISGSDRDLHMLHLAGATPEGPCPHWRSFLADITGGNKAFEDYLQRLVGYTLTGETSEEMFAFLHGPANTGKSKFVGALQALHATYGVAASMDSFTVARGERHPTDLAGWVGKRLVTAAETEEGRRWDRQRLTTLTGRDKISARFMRGDFFEYEPRFTLVFHGNFRPRLGANDEAMRRRTHLCPFRFRPKRIDAHLAEKFLAELSGIMLWAVEGAVLWYRHGLQPPNIIKSATDSYFASENTLQDWLDERCEREPNLTALTRDLYRDYSAWIKQANEFLPSERRFSEMLEQLLGEEARWRQERGRGFRGLALKHRNEELPF